MHSFSYPNSFTTQSTPQQAELQLSRLDPKWKSTAFRSPKTTNPHFSSVGKAMMTGPRVRFLQSKVNPTPPLYCLQMTNLTHFAFTAFMEFVAENLQNTDSVYIYGRFVWSSEHVVSNGRKLIRIHVTDLLAPESAETLKAVRPLFSS